MMHLMIRYAAKQRRVGLADRLGKLAMELQEKEEKDEEKKTAEQDDEEEEGEESQDMFAPTQETNPFLASRETPKLALLPSQSKEKARNPFAKRTENASSPR